MDKKGVLGILLILLLLMVLNLDVSNASIIIRRLVEAAAAAAAAAVGESSHINHTAPPATTAHIGPSPSPVVGNNTLYPKANDSNLNYEPPPPTHSSNISSNSNSKVFHDPPSAHHNDTDYDSPPPEIAIPPSSNQTDIRKENANSSSNDTTSSAYPPTGSQMNDDHKLKHEDDGARGSNETVTISGSPPAESHKGNQKPPKKEDDKTDAQVVHGQTCEGFVSRCNDRNSLLACVQSFDTGSKKLVALVQNEGDDQLKVNFPDLPIGYNMGELVIAKHQTKQINISLGQTTKVVLNAGSGDCVLQVAPPVSAGNFFVNLPSYNQLFTPINGAYLLIVTVLILGGTWACCKFRKRRRQGSVPYQELEMGMPESISVNNVVSAEGWDEYWDDDWDEGNAEKSPGGYISANGLTSRTTNRDGWEKDWDD